MNREERLKLARENVEEGETAVWRENRHEGRL
jgi:hypothetical protein